MELILLAFLLPFLGLCALAALAAAFLWTIEKIDALKNLMSTNWRIK